MKMIASNNNNNIAFVVFVLLCGIVLSNATTSTIHASSTTTTDDDRNDMSANGPYCLTQYNIYWGFASDGKKDVIVGACATGIGGEIVFTSDAGKYKWTEKYPGKLGNLWAFYDVIHSATMDQFLAVGFVAQVYTSADALTWNQQYTGQKNFAYNRVKQLNDGSYWIIADAGYALQSKNEGVNWTIINIRQTSHQFLYGIAEHPSEQLIVVAGGQYSNEGPIVFSTDKGATWYSAVRAQKYAYLRDLVYGNGLFVAVGAWSTSEESADEQGVVMVSSDGVHWNTTLALQKDKTAFFAVVYSETVGFVVAGHSVHVSRDGYAWRDVTSHPTKLDDIHWINQLRLHPHTGDIVAVGNYNLVWSSKDGVKWSDRAPPAPKIRM